MVDTGMVPVQLGPTSWHLLALSRTTLANCGSVERDETETQGEGYRVEGEVVTGRVGSFMRIETGRGEY